jgi:hypothetical protein
MRMVMPECRITLWVIDCDTDYLLHNGICNDDYWSLGLQLGFDIHWRHSV